MAGMKKIAPKGKLGKKAGIGSEGYGGLPHASGQVKGPKSKAQRTAKGGRKR